MLLSTPIVLNYNYLCEGIKIHEDDAVQWQHSPLKEVFRGFPQAQTSADDEELLEQVVQALKLDQRQSWVCN